MASLFADENDPIETEKEGCGRKINCRVKSLGR